MELNNLPQVTQIAVRIQTCLILKPIISSLITWLQVKERAVNATEHLFITAMVLGTLTVRYYLIHNCSGGVAIVTQQLKNP